MTSWHHGTEVAGTGEPGTGDGGLRILLVLTTSTGGVGTHVASLVHRFAAAGHTVGVIGSPETEDHFGFGRVPGVRFVPLDVGTGLGVRDLRTVARLAHLVDTFHADVVHAHGFRAGFLTLAALDRLRADPLRRRGGTSLPVSLVTWHNRAMATGLRGRAETAVQTYVARRADRTLGASADLVEQARERGASDAVLAPVAAPDVGEGTAAEAAALRARLTTEFDLPRDSLLAVCVGRVAPQKNYTLLMRALARVSARIPRLHVLVAGTADEAELEKVRALVEADDLPVHFLGQRADVGDLLRAADLFVLTSLWDARALVLQEAMIVGTPIIATAVGGTPELVGEAGILVDPDDPAALGEALVHLAEDPAARVALGEAAARLGADLPDEDRAAALVLDHYRDLLTR
ncbi:glycosyltransferase family 4 protein [Brevibacterium litoralis]|uniref:glycosyltransferase family 4 protein n=1 Tax=Brevibacterium litoralis TaxID=3138935 RepID=UPI0032ED1B1D